MSGSSVLIAPEWLGHSGLWQFDAKGRRRAVDAEDIGLSEALADRLETWMDAFDAIYDEDDETASDFPNEVERLSWEAEGQPIDVKATGILARCAYLSTDPLLAPVIKILCDLFGRTRHRQFRSPEQAMIWVLQSEAPPPETISSDSDH